MDCSRYLLVSMDILCVLLLCLLTNVTGEVLVEKLRVKWLAYGETGNPKYTFTINATIGFYPTTDYVSGHGLWKLSMYGSPNKDGSGNQFQRVDQMLTSRHQSQDLSESNREEMIFYGVEGELNFRAIGCNKELRYVCFDFSKGDNPEPNFVFSSLQEDTTKMTLCSDQCKQPTERFAVKSMKIMCYWTQKGRNANQKSTATINATIHFSEATNYISGSGLWKLSMFGSPNEDGTGNQFQRVDQMLTSEQQSQDLTESNREEMKFYNVKGELDILSIGCGKEFRYVCIEFSKGDTPEPDFVFTAYQKDSSKMTWCYDICKKPKGDVVAVASLRVQWVANSDSETKQKTLFSINATIGFSETTEFVKGSGLWKLAVYVSPNEDGTGNQFHRLDQMLSLQQQSQDLTESNREEIIFYNVEGETDLDILSVGCGKEFRYVCFDFTKGDNPEPNFDFTSNRIDSTKATLCSDQCKKHTEEIVVKSLQIQFEAKGKKSYEKIPFIINATVSFSEALNYVRGSGLWKLSMYGSPNEDGTGMQFRKEFRFVCFDFSKGDNPEPDFVFRACQKDSRKMTSCFDQCNQHTAQNDVCRPRDPFVVDGQIND